MIKAPNTSAGAENHLERYGHENKCTEIDDMVDRRRIDSRRPYQSRVDGTRQSRLFAAGTLLLLAHVCRRRFACGEFCFKGSLN